MLLATSILKLLKVTKEEWSAELQRQVWCCWQNVNHEKLCYSVPLVYKSLCAST